MNFKFEASLTGFISEMEKYVEKQTSVMIESLYTVDTDLTIF